MSKKNTGSQPHNSQQARVTNPIITQLGMLKSTLSNQGQLFQSQEKASHMQDPIPIVELSCSIQLISETKRNV